MSCPPELAGPGQCCLGDPRPRIDQVRSAVNDFLVSPDSAGINVGIGYFGYFPSGNTSCNPDDYSQAAVPIGLLPDNAPAIANSLNSISPVGETPTGAAIRGACAYAQGWRNQNPGFNVVTLLVTDGVPETPVSRNCDANLPDAENAAGECQQAGVPTYVLGVGANLDNLSRLAQAGGTGDAYLVGAGQDVTGAVLAALNQIRDSASVPCDFAIPPPPSGQQLDPNLVNVTYKDPNGSDHLIRGVVDAGGCGADGGWHYDNNANPQLVQLCPASCNDVTAALISGSVLGRNTSIDIRYGCGTVGIAR
jgi:hypothetical protein